MPAKITKQPTPAIIRGVPRGDWRQIIAANFKREQERLSTIEKEVKQ